MQSYSYHLKLELYAAPNLTTTKAKLADDGGGSNDSRIWVPRIGASIFNDLPSHPRNNISPDVWSRRPPSTAQSSLPHHREPQGGIIDCGAERSRAEGSTSNAGKQPSTSRSGNYEFYSERQWRARSHSNPPPGFKAGIGPRTAAKDWRFGRVRIESFDRVNDTMAGQANGEGRHAAASLGPNLGGMGQATKGRYVPLETKNTEAGWGIVHLYREAGENSALKAVPEGEGGEGEDGTVLCILAVPSYLSPGDFLGFVGEKWRGDVCHYRMVMTSRQGRYMVLMKFREKDIAERWRQEFDGKPFDRGVPEVCLRSESWRSLLTAVQPEICHVTYIKSITVETPDSADKKTQQKDGHRFDASSSTIINSLKPFPPPTPNLIELPTCAVCLERMDDTAGLMTILCQHVFHCTCLQTWKGYGCPICRATNPVSKQKDPDDPDAVPFGSGASNFCNACDSTDDLWICLICGNVGCGRYKGGHAKEHWKETAHSFSLELETQHVWDYAGDMWVHRLIRDKGDGKVVDFSANNNSSRRRGNQNGEEEDVVPRAKLDHIGMEYTHLLTSQLESQRIYFEEMVNKAADKAAKAAAMAESASLEAGKAIRELADLREEHRVLKNETVPSLEKEIARERNRANKSTELARSLGKSLQEEKEVSQGLMKRIEHLNQELENVAKTTAALKEENEELKEMNRDLTMFISGQEKLKELEAEGKVDAEELEGGSMLVPEKKGKGKGKGKKK